MQNIPIKSTVGVPAVLIDSISKPVFYLNEVTGVYRATLDCLNGESHVCTKEVYFTQEEYDAWGTDNKYIYDLIYTKLNLILA